MSLYKFLVDTHGWTRWKSRTNAAYQDHLKVSYWIFRLAKHKVKSHDWHFLGITEADPSRHDVQFSVQIARQNIIKRFRISETLLPVYPALYRWQVTDNQGKTLGSASDPSLLRENHPASMQMKRILTNTLDEFIKHMKE